ncbi:MAG: hypothetical protein HYS27_21995 [Deltaproteobacteria bacterium]|nr:hypothetical protein [Deltaproteobacteria bacterium]
MAVGPIRIAARLDYATLEELEAGFAERLGERELFLAHGSFGSLPDEPRVGASVVVEVATAAGETALALDGVIAWAYPPTLVPPGREPGTGIAIDRFRDGCEARAQRMRRRGGAGVRVRPPGSRLKAPAIDRGKKEVPTPRKLPASLFETGAQPQPTAPEPSWHAPAPRLMGLSLERSLDKAPVAALSPLPREVPDHHLPAPPVRVGADVPSAVSLDGLPDLPGAGGSSAFEQVPTDVDLLRSVSDAQLVEEERRGALFDRRPLIDVTGPRVAPLAVPASVTVPVVPAGELAAAPPPPAEPEVVSDEDVSPVDEDSTGSHEVPISKLPSLEAADFETADHQTVAPPTSSSGAADWEGRTEHGLDASEPTAEASEPDRTALPARPLPEPPAWPIVEPRPQRPLGIAFMVARRTHEPVALEVLTWPAAGTKRVGALEEARAQGGEALDQAIASSQWLARDASSDTVGDGDELPREFDAGLTDPGRRVVDVVGAAVQAAADEPDEDDVFSERLARPASTLANPALDEATVAEDVEVPPAPAVDEAATVAGEDTADGVRGAAPLLPDDEIETDRELRRPPTEASPATRSRLGVLQRFLGKR